MTNEIWKPIRDWPYEVSSLGRVRRTAAPQGRTRAGKIIKPRPLTKRAGYMLVTLTHEGRRWHARVCRLVCEAFHGPPPTPRHEAAHLDGVNTNDTPGNLAWKTKAENEADKVGHGTRARGERMGNAVLSDDRVRAIRADSRPAKEVAADHGIHVSHVYMIKRRKIWKHVA